MSDSVITLGPAEEAIITYEVSDEALETAAGASSRDANYTLYFCTALDLCPGP